MKPHTSHLRPDGTTWPPVTPDPPPPPGYVDPLEVLESDVPDDDEVLRQLSEGEPQPAARSPEATGPTA